MTFLQLIKDALSTVSEAKASTSAVVWRDQAREWFLSNSPQARHDRQYIIQIGCGFDDYEEKVNFIKAAIKSNTSYLDLKKDLGVLINE